MCVGVKERQKTNTGESESVLHLCASMCVCKVNIRFYRLLLFAGLLQHATRENENNREREREGRMGQLHGVPLFWAFYTFGAP